MNEKKNKTKKETVPENKAKKETDPEQPEQIEPATAPNVQTGQPPVQEEESLRDQLLRLRADFDNFRKRTQRERNELFLLANESLFLELLPVIDHFEMGLKSAEEHRIDRSVADGFRLVYNQLLDLLKKFNVTPIDAVGKTFDPHRHEALTHLPSDQPAETVIEQVRRGYLMGEKLLRAAQVVVSSGSPENKESE
ncbi:MAG: molecular chaperone GrpE [Verrucomicrobiota bacterium]|jgi:molecular chaperone GrpE|nr:molecular chaperone GrpE [Verrucomicrobiota bacterium]MDK2963576.1 molecular chaperone GrpE [Verrucomicrobiota bacterium]